MQIVRIGLDLAKYVFRDSTAWTLMARRWCARRFAVMPYQRFLANLPPCLVGMEASNGAHFWAKTLLDLGHDVRLISPQFVTPYVKSKKNDQGNRRRGDLRGSGPTQHALRARQVRRTASGASGSSDSGHSPGC